MVRHRSVQYDVPWLTALVDLYARGSFNENVIKWKARPDDEETRLVEVLEAVAVLLPDNTETGKFAEHLRAMRLSTVERLIALRRDRKRYASTPRQGSR